MLLNIILRSFASMLNFKNTILSLQNTYASDYQIRISYIQVAQWIFTLNKLGICLHVLM